MAKGENREIEALNGLRGLGALWVMVFHYYIGATFSTKLTTLFCHGYLTVDLFCVLSGFVLAWNYAPLFASGVNAASFRRFLGRRIARIYPLYLLVTAVAAAMVLAGLLDWPHWLGVGATVALSVFMVQCWGLTQSLDPPAWSISAEFAAYLAFPFLLAPCLFGGVRRAWLVAGACAVVLAALTQVPMAWEYRYNQGALLDISEPLYGLPVFRCLADFTLGMLAVRLKSTALGAVLTGNVWVSAAICGVTLLLMLLPSTDVAVVLLIPLLVFSLTAPRSVLGRLLATPPAEFLGRVSYSVYLIHFLFLGVLDWVNRQAASHRVPAPHTVAAGVTILLTLAVAQATTQLIDVPGRRWVRALFEGGSRRRLVAEPSAP